MTRRISLRIEYDGTDFVGWQMQTNGRSVQVVLESVVRDVFHEKVRVIGAGRTDSGVHARGQVAHVDLKHALAPERIVPALNSKLPPDIRVHNAAIVAATFHARRDAIRRRYCYYLSDAAVPPVLDRHRIAHSIYTLDHTAMHAAAQAWLGKHDYSAFRPTSCQAESPIRSIDLFHVARAESGILVFTVEARAFLHHQVRNMVGTLVEIGRGAQPVSWGAAVLAGKDRSAAGPTGAAHGLILEGVWYRKDPFAL